MQHNWNIFFIIGYFTIRNKGWCNNITENMLYVCISFTYLRLLILYWPAVLWLNCVWLFYYDTSQGRNHKKKLSWDTVKVSLNLGATVSHQYLHPCKL